LLLEDDFAELELSTLEEPGFSLLEEFASPLEVGFALLEDSPTFMSHQVSIMLS
jgi:hypothetical protein